MAARSVRLGVSRRARAAALAAAASHAKQRAHDEVRVKGGMGVAATLSEAARPRRGEGEGRHGCGSDLKRSSRKARHAARARPFPPEHDPFRPSTTLATRSRCAVPVKTGRIHPCPLRQARATRHHCRSPKPLRSGSPTPSGLPLLLKAAHGSRSVIGNTLWWLRRQGRARPSPRFYLQLIRWRTPPFPMMQAAAAEWCTSRR